VQREAAENLHFSFGLASELQQVRFACFSNKDERSGLQATDSARPKSPNSPIKFLQIH